MSAGSRVPETLKKVSEGAAMDRKTFEAFRDLVYAKSGINLGDHKQALVCARVSKRLRVLGLPGYKEYLQFVCKDESGEELVKLLDVISTNVTHFFREARHFEILDGLLRDWIEAGQTRFRIWSAAGSTGEEPYSIAMTAQEAMGESAGFDLKILATDISTGVLETARRGIYEERKLESVPERLRRKYFRQGVGQARSFYLVSESLRRMVTFGRLNLSVQPFPLKGPLDVIFCRNVMIYFDNQVRGRVLENMYSLLRPGGYLMVGHAESLTGLVSDFRSVMPSVYVKGPS